ncbi:OmpA family protein [uncultured Halopseudomonas sp.]|uniref:OmpA family protein n=1 Tax=uncultured Halopseudomonas sp. TaxID=2901193 RepID=UPI0030ED5402|tara:strand:+ start:678 stop:1520 length:843 start_codon:yes stop_codon:yes gene_type:complete
MNKLTTISTALAAAIGLSACASQPNSNLQQAEAQYAQLQSDPRASQMAALETEDAGQALDKASQAYENGDEERVDQLSYVAQRRIELAEQTIALRSAEKELEQSAAKRAEAQLSAREQQLQSSKQQLQLSKQELAAREQQIRKLQNELEAKQTERGTLVTLGDVLFDVDKSELKPSGVRDVQKLASFLNDNPERQLVVEGYTDSTGADSYNQQLSQRRAESVQRALVRAGVDSRRIQVVGYGEQYPVASNDSASSRSQNRRVEVTISDDDQRVAPRSSVE